MKRAVPTYSSDFLTALRRQLSDAISTRQAIDMSGLFSAEEREQLIKKQDWAIRTLEARIADWKRLDRTRGEVIR